MADDNSKNRHRRRSRPDQLDELVPDEIRAEVRRWIFEDVIMPAVEWTGHMSTEAYLKAAEIADILSKFSVF